MNPTSSTVDGNAADQAALKSACSGDAYVIVHSGSRGVPVIDERRVNFTRQLQNKREGSLGRRRLANWQLQLGAACERRPVRALRLAREHLGERDAAALGIAASIRRNLQRPPREPAHRLAPYGVVETHRQAALDRAHSAFAVCGAHLIDDGREVLAAGWRRAQSLVYTRHGGRRADLHQL